MLKDSTYNNIKKTKGKIQYRELKEPCKSLLENNRCLGCTGLAELDWEEPQRCPYIKTYSSNWKINF